MPFRCFPTSSRSAHFIYKYQNGEVFSKTLAAQVEVERHIETQKTGIEKKIEAARKKREELKTACVTEGLKIIERTWDGAVDDLERTDAEGKLIECSVMVQVENAEQAAKAIQLCKVRNLMAMPIGAKTSGLGVFEAMGTASQKGFEGVLGIQMRGFESYEPDEGKDEKPAANLIQIPEYDSTRYDLVRHQTLPLALLKSKTFPEDPSTPHRVIAHAGCTVDVVNQFLKDKLPSDHFVHRIINDLTTRKEAQLGGVISTGAEGGNRSKPTEDIVSTGIVDAHGDARSLDREESQKIIGLNGATLVTQVEFEVTALPKHEHAIFIPIRGTGEEKWKNMLRLQQKLTRYCRSKEGNRRILQGDTANGLIITGMEPLSRSALNIALETRTERDRDQYGAMLAEEEIGIYVTFNSFAESGNAENELMGLINEELGADLGMEAIDFESDFFNETTGNIRIPETTTDPVTGEKIQNPKTHGEIRIFGEEERETMDEIRHGAPSHSKEKATKLGGQTQSTDLNIRFTSDDPETRERAIATIAKIYQEYEAAFKPEDGFRVVIYGHLHPGLTEEGGGFDPHIRIIFELSNPGSRYNAPEKVQAMKKRQTRLYEKLLALDGMDGIEIRCPEKSRFTNKEYWKWLCLFKPEEARRYVEALEEYGYSRDEADELDRPIIGSRIPHEIAGGIRKVPGGIKALLNQDLIADEDPGTERIAGMDPLLKKYWGAILEISQLSHRGGLIKRMVGEVQRSLHDTWALSEKQYALFIEDPSEGEKIVARNFGENYAEAGYRVEQVAAESLEAFRDQFPDDKKTFYVVNLHAAGVPKGLSILVAPHESIKDAYVRTVDGRNKAAFRNLYTMWDKWPYETDETPNLPAIAALGVLLQRNELDEQAGAKRPPILTTNPGPAQINPAIREGAQAVFDVVQTLEEDPQAQRHVIARFKRFVGIPQAHSIAFFTSATQIMQMLAEALAPKKETINVMQVTNDSFSERLHSVLSSEGVPVKRIETPWGTSEHSEMKKVVRALLAAWDPTKKNILFVTPHKTSTAADFLPQRLIDALARAGKIMGRDYEMICDVTSGIGARDYATGIDPDQGTKRVPFTGLFGSLQKGGEQAPGFAVVSVSPQLKATLGLEPTFDIQRTAEGGLAPTLPEGEPKFSLRERLHRTEGGEVINPLGLAMLQQKLEADEAAQRTPEVIQEETRKKVSLVLGWMQRHPDLMTLVPNALDASPVLFGIFSQAKNLVVAKRLMAEIFGYYLGGGYGPYEKEAIRLYLPNIAMDDLKDMLAALDYVLKLPDVVKTRGEQIPNIALREPHEPLNVIERVAADFSVDDIFKDSLGLHWLERLIKTYNCIQEERAHKLDRSDPTEAQKLRKTQVRLGGNIPKVTTEYHTRAQIYAFDENLSEMEKVVHLEDSETHLSLAYYYHQYLQVEQEIRDRVLGQPEATYGEDATFTAEMDVLIERAKANLTKVASLLRKYVEGNGNPAVKGERDEAGRVKTPLAA